jgi:hypothetical protein
MGFSSTKQRNYQMTDKETAAEIMLRSRSAKPQGFPVDPKIKVTANQSKIEAFNTTGGQQKSEANYQKIIDRAVNIPANDRPTSRK